MRESCRTIFDSNGQRCSNEADVIVWGKLFNPEHVGPRCWDCAERQLGFNHAHDRQWAIYRIPKEGT